MAVSRAPTNEIFRLMYLSYYGKNKKQEILVLKRKEILFGNRVAIGKIPQLCGFPQEPKVHLPLSVQRKRSDPAANFGLTTHLRSAIFCSTEEERKQAQQSKIRRQMKLNRRILTKITPFSKELNCGFFLAENQHQKYYLQKHYRLCESLSLRSTQQFVESYLACKLNGYVHV
ncbi:hypothetical protein RND71_019534 [Anisodus tanguticus]|uniref:peptide-methionine (S)-S-oxide reductase n=1 Tax=Anisodus tanguticus TaxID=243964 RepID=A0AAE1RZM0_9SOLA|nr:hypothetical protein RND71_019534 [Anisodus tanguticus]